MSFYYNIYIYSVNCKYTYTHYVVHVLSAIFSSQTVGNFAFVCFFCPKWQDASFGMVGFEWQFAYRSGHREFKQSTLWSKLQIEVAWRLGKGWLKDFPGVWKKKHIFLVRLVSQAPSFYYRRSIKKGTNGGWLPQVFVMFVVLLFETWNEGGMKF